MLPRARAASLAALALPGLAAAQDGVTLNRPGDGYRGIWYSNQPSGDEYAFKYSGGLGTYCAKHQPFAVHSAEANRTYFCWGGTTAERHDRLLHMVSYYDHASGTVPRPTILLDKGTPDAHDNPVIALDGDGRIWIFSTSHGRSRPSYVHRSVRPHDVTDFERVAATYEGEGGVRRPLDNFSYMQAWRAPGGGFACFFTRYDDPAPRTSVFMTSPDGVRWSRWRRLAAIEEGHYTVSACENGKLAAALNAHPAGKGLNWRTNLYYLESEDRGATWRTAGGEPLEPPLAAFDSPALVRDYRAEGRNVYLKDLRIDAEGRPVVLYVTSGGYRSGPGSGPRVWTLARWTGEDWTFTEVTTSDSNYDMGSLYLEPDRWRIIAPTDPGPQPFNPGGEMVAWTSPDGGRTWEREARLTAGSPRNHGYARRPTGAHPGFVALWADGHGREPSESRLYFCDREGRVFLLPPEMGGERAVPVELERPADDLPR